MGVACWGVIANPAEGDLLRAPGPGEWAIPGERGFGVGSL